MKPKTRRIALQSALLAACGGVMLASGVFLHLSPQLPSVEALKNLQLQTPMRVYTREGDFIGQFGEKKRNPLPFDAIPPRFIEALLAAEDDAFFSHVGIDVGSLLRAVSELLLTGEKVTGGSTLTMQVARNHFLTLERTFTRKFKEILLSLAIERVFDKEEIFEIYFNQMFLGHRAYGFEAAAQVYYGAHIDGLSTAQLAMLAALPKAPSRLNPVSNPDRALVRRNWILRRMYNLNYISRSEYRAARAEPITAQLHGAQLAYDAPYAAEMARREMLRLYGDAAYSDGYHVYTTLSSRLQLAAEDAVVAGLTEYDARHGYRGPEAHYPPGLEAREDWAKWLDVLAATDAVAGRIPAIVTNVGEYTLRALLVDGGEVVLGSEAGLHELRPYVNENYRDPTPPLGALFKTGDLIRLRESGGDLRIAQLPAAQGALVALRPDDGAILSVIGGLGFATSEFNRATQAKRQPGSSFKPFMYAAALEHGFTAASIINDAPVVFDDGTQVAAWRPQNDSGRFSGPTRLRWALTKSRNLVSIRLLQELGVRNLINYAERVGFDSETMEPNLSLALGTQETTPLQLAAAYAVIANGGYRVAPYLIASVRDMDGEEIYRARPATVCRECGGEDAAEALGAAAADAELSMEEILNAPEDAPPPPAERVIDERVAFIVDSMLKDVIVRGTGTRARELNRTDIAGKTGTTNGPTDAWFCGYNPDVVTTTWVGFDSNQPLGHQEYGGSAALPVWIEFMRAALRSSPPRQRAIPEGVVNVRIDPETGLLAAPGQRDAIFEFFRVENVPTRRLSAR